MKKLSEKSPPPTLKKIKEPKEQTKRLNFSTYKEDFVITAQEEKEGGFWGGVHLKIASAYK